VDKTAKIFRCSCWIEDHKHVFISDALHSLFIRLENAHKIVVLFLLLCLHSYVLFCFFLLILFLFELRKTFSGCHGRWDGHVNPEGNKQIRERGVRIIVCDKFKQFHGFSKLVGRIGL